MADWSSIYTHVTVKRHVTDDICVLFRDIRNDTNFRIGQATYLDQANANKLAEMKLVAQRLVYVHCEQSLLVTVPLNDLLCCGCMYACLQYAQGYHPNPPPRGWSVADH